jgi:hypothetical protein
MGVNSRSSRLDGWGFFGQMDQFGRYALFVYETRNVS